MSAQGLFGPQNANATTSLPSGTDKKRYGIAQTWVKDASAPGRNDGTVLDASFFNRIIGNLERVVMQTGLKIQLGDMTALYRAIQHLINTAVFKRLRFDGVQELTPTEQSRGRANLGLSAVAGSGNYEDLANTPNFGSIHPLWGISGGGSQVGNVDIAVKQSDLDARYVLVGDAHGDELSSSGMQINGTMEISQDNGTSAVTLTATGTLQFRHLVDGVVAAIRGTFVAAGQQVAAPTGMPCKTALRVTVGTAQASLGVDDELTLMFPIEGLRASRVLLGTAYARPQSIGFWISSNRTGLFSGAIMNSAKTRSYPVSFTIAAANTPQWVSLSGLTSIPGDTSGTWLNDTGVGEYVCICLAGGTNRLGAPNAWATTTSPGRVGATGSLNGVGATSDVFYVSQLIVVPGLQIPSSERVYSALRAYGLEFNFAQRYFEQNLDTVFDYGFSGNVTSESVYYSQQSFAREKRIVPPVFTLVANTHASQFPAAVGTAVASVKGFTEARTANATGAGQFRSTWKADARLS